MGVRLSTWRKSVAELADADAELPAGLLQRTRDAMSAETGVRLDIHAAHADWQRWVTGMKEPIRSPAGHFVDFCKRRAKELK